MGAVYISELLTQEELKDVTEKTGTGLELIRFSVGENLDAFDSQIREAREALAPLGCRGLCRVFHAQGQQHLALP